MIFVIGDQVANTMASGDTEPAEEGSFRRSRNMMMSPTQLARNLVSKEKKRYVADGYDLDLTYITPSVIAMGLPAFGSEATYRNPIDDVVRFFNHYHKEQFLVFNLCAERSYDADLFGGHVERIPVEDHNPPSFDTLVQFLHRVEIFLDQNPNNVIAVHCKGGKGRTGVFISAWLRYR